MPSLERWYVLSSVVRRYISFYLQWDTFSGTLVYFVIFIVSGTSMYSLLISSVVRWYISLHIISGTVVYLSSYHQWYGGISLFMSSVVRRYIFSYHQWYDGVISVNR